MEHRNQEEEQEHHLVVGVAEARQQKTPRKQAVVH